MADNTIIQPDGSMYRQIDDGNTKIQTQGNTHRDETAAAAAGGPNVGSLASMGAGR